MRIGVLIGAGILLAGPAFASGYGDPEGMKVHFATTVVAGVEAKCLVAKADDGKTYNVTGLVPDLAAGDRLKGTATLTDEMSTCQQGAVVAHFVPDPEPPTPGGY